MQPTSLEIVYEIIPHKCQVATWTGDEKFYLEYACTICNHKVIKSIPKKPLIDNPHSYETAFTLSLEEQACPHIFHSEGKKLIVSINQITTCIEALHKKIKGEKG